VRFNNHNNFYLNPVGWGEAQDQDIIMVLESVISEFYKNLDSNIINPKLVRLLNSNFKNPPINHPQIIKTSECNVIYLSVENRLWSKYSYQFAHELCHHIIDSDFYTSNDKFGWFEESICELSSIYCINKMSDTWKTNPPYFHWSEYSKSLKEYADEIINKEENLIEIPFNNWLSQNLSQLYKDRYKRKENRIIAIKLYEIFNEYPDCWMTIQYLKKIEVDNNMELIDFLTHWKESVPNDLKTFIDKIRISLTEE
tara:strand:+ start:991 stop:1755 length:765 start_codon:yes stop_codon:yes gene_type:complete